MGILAETAKIQLEANKGKLRIGMSYSKTSDRLFAPYFKTVSRREWSQRHKLIMSKYLNQGLIMPVFDNLPRTGNCTQLGWQKLTSLRQEMLREITPEEVVKEGFPELTPDEFLARFFPAESPDSCIVRVEFIFEPLELENA